MPLTLARLGAENKIKKIRGPQDIVKHLRDMGFMEGEPIKVISEARGNLIVEVKQTRFALDKKFASKIMV